MYACYIGHDNIVNLLLEASVDVNCKNLNGQTPLMLAASCGNESVGYFLCQVCTMYIFLHANLVCLLKPNLMNKVVFFF